MTIRCSAEKAGSRCAKPAEEHYEHLSWRGDQAIRWNDAPIGPTSDIGYEAAAWELTGALGLIVRVADLDHGDLFGNALVIDGDDFKRWWDEKSEVILAAWENRDLPERLRQMYEDSPAWNDPLGKRLKDQSQERYADAEETGNVHARRLVDICLLPDCGGNGEAH